MAGSDARGLQLSCLCRTTHCALRSERRAIDASNAACNVQIYAFPEGSKDESATFVNTLKVFQSVLMSVW